MAETYNPEIHGPYGQWLREKGVHTRAGGWTHATRDQVLVDTKDEKRVRDQLGNEVRQYGRDQQDVTINAPHIRVAATTKEERNV